MKFEVRFEILLKFYRNLLSNFYCNFFRDDLPPLAPARPFSMESDQSLGTRLSELAYREELRQVKQNMLECDHG